MGLRPPAGVSVLSSLGARGLRRLRKVLELAASGPSPAPAARPGPAVEGASPGDDVQRLRQELTDLRVRQELLEARLEAVIARLIHLAVEAKDAGPVRASR